VIDGCIHCLKTSTKPHKTLSLHLDKNLLFIVNLLERGKSW